MGECRCEGVGGRCVQCEGDVRVWMGVYSVRVWDG